MNPGLAKGLFASIPLLLSGCASYYTHYAVFPAENSTGEQRQVKVTWQTADYPDWWISDDQSTPITLETQCSTRTWRIVDRTHTGADDQDCAPGIRACGASGQDHFADDMGREFDERACIRVNPSDPDALVTDISTSLKLLVSCRPVETSRQIGDETENTDYLRASPVPYTVHSRKGVRGRLDSKPPELDDSICDDE
ncbi:hypothetical protein [Marinobacter sp. CHS3-4]|uniref:hypothetical protein n=1 Tax=Marinobacter sp. CHS3-4 TaxID=3045174 RepID=UPI0024B57BA8|nr:hypothetical protein [Marinobacter sp. CHS3-4]MDI9245195.1 hypothetical protein [Marinobacter sp. CHS3-4]